jgi:hypothetical protein
MSRLLPARTGRYLGDGGLRPAFGRILLQLLEPGGDVR